MQWYKIIIIIIIIIIYYKFIKLNTFSKYSKQYIKHKYTPRSFKDEQDKPIPINNIFNIMFAKPSPWMMSRNIGINDRRITDMSKKI
jgi:hypothetical protein